MADIDYIDDMYNRVRPVRLPEEYGKPQVDQTKILLQSANEALAPQVLAQEALKQSVSNQAEEIKKYQSPQRNDLADAIMLLGAPLLGALGGEAGALSAPKAYAGASGIYEGQIKEEREKQKLLREAATKKLDEDRKRMYELGSEVSKGKLSSGKDIAEMELENKKQEEAMKRAKVIASGRTLESATKLRKEFYDRPELKNFADVKQSYEKIKKIVIGPSSAAGDMSLIFSYMKMLDPGSVVREGEQATAEQARGVPESILNLYNKLVTGEKLTPDQRKDFMNRAGDLYSAQQNVVSNIEGEYKQYASEYGVPEQIVIGRPSQPIKLEPTYKDGEVKVVKGQEWVREGGKWIPKRK
jgi:hypothetical protein